MLKVIKLVFGKCTIQDPDSFRDKIKLMIKDDRAKKKLLILKSASTFSSLFSKSQMSAGTKSADSSANENEDNHYDSGDS